MLILAGVTEELKCRDDETCIRSEAVLAAMCVNMNKVNGESINPWSDDGERGGACVSGTTKCKDNSFCMSDNSADGTGVCLALCSVDIAVNNCTQQCTSKECGPDGCGGSCGRCDAGKICSQEGKCQ